MKTFGKTLACCVLSVQRAKALCVLSVQRAKSLCVLFVQGAKALKGRVISAQGNALGQVPKQYPALKGRVNFEGVMCGIEPPYLSRPYRALHFSMPLPRALPWAEMTRPFRAFHVVCGKIKPYSFACGGMKLAGVAQNKWLRMGFGWFVAVGCLLLAVASHADEPDTARYQMAIDRKNENNATLYVMDMVTGKILSKDLRAQGSTWSPVLTGLTPATFDDVIEKNERAKKAENEYHRKFNEAYNTMWQSFRTETLEKQVNMAETIMVLQYTNKFDDAVNSRVSTTRDVARSGMIRPGIRPVSSGFGVVEVLKGSGVSETGGKIRSQSSGNVDWNVSFNPLRYPVAGERHNQISHAIRETMKNTDMGETILYFSVPNEEFDFHAQFIIASKRLNLPEHTWQYAVVSSEREPAELVADIKTILAKEGHDAKAD